MIRALRDRVRPADGDPVDVVEVRSDASDVVKFADILDQIGADASSAQRAKADLGEQLKDVAELRGQIESDAYGLLPPEESEALSARLRAFEERSGEAVLPSAVEATASGGGAKAPAEDFHVAVDTRLQAAEARLKEQHRAADVREDAVVERADRLQRAFGAEDGDSVVRLALETAQKIAAERNRAIAAQTDRLEAKNAGALG